MVVDDPLALIFSNIFLRLGSVLCGTDVVLKLEGFSITGSIKIKSALFMIQELERRGVAHPGATTIVESSSGNLGIALSMICRRRGYRFLCISDPNIAQASLRAMTAYGADVVIVRERDSNGGYLETRIAYIKQLITSHADIIWLNQYNNRANMMAHYEMTAREILAEYPSPDWVFLGTGSTGTFTGCARRFREAAPGTRVVAVEPVGSVTFGGLRAGVDPGDRHEPPAGVARGRLR